MRVLARLMDAEQALVLQWPQMWELPPDSVVDVALPPIFDWGELRMCDCCGR